MGKLKALLSICAKTTTKIIPISPPMMQIRALSNKNSIKMVRFLAPIAFLSPMMGVLSLTVTNMMLAIPKAPTIRLSRPIIHPPRLMLPNSELTALLKSLMALRAKSSSSTGPRRWMDRIAPLSSSFNASVLMFSGPFTMILGLLNLSLNNICFMNRYESTMLWSNCHPSMKLLPCFFITPTIMAFLFLRSTSFPTAFSGLPKSFSALSYPMMMLGLP